MSEDGEYTSYSKVKARLDEIVEAVSDDELPIDEALSLYEEAVKLGLAASDLIERDMEEHQEGGSEDDETAVAAAEDAAEPDTIKTV